MALLLSAAGFLPAQNLVDVPLDGLQLLKPLFLCVIGVIQAGFLETSCSISSCNAFRAGSLVMPCALKYRAAASAMIKSLSCACRYASRALGISALSGRRGRVWSWRRPAPVAAIPFPLQLRFQCFQFAAGLAHFLIGGINGGF